MATREPHLETWLDVCCFPSNDRHLVAAVHEPDQEPTQHVPVPLDLAKKLADSLPQQRSVPSQSSLTAEVSPLSVDGRRAI